ncbi:MAG: reverse transcriptase domain-containing protein [Bacilli bacterium]|nr:reverse transcriptase domain-containing protein [Bacilli bacterium]
MANLIKNNQSKLYNRGSKRYITSLLSDTRKNIYFTKNDLNNIIYKYDKLEVTFYENKKTKKRCKKRPKDYNCKKYRKFTDVCEPRKTALKRLNFYLSQLSIPDYVFAKTDGGFVKNARHHRGNINFLLIDIASFYPNCTLKYVKNFFQANGGLKMKRDLAQRMAELVTTPVKDNNRVRVIPQGFSTSTLISFFAYRKMFGELNKLAIENNLIFSTYVDDVTFSTKDDDFNFEDIIIKIEEILNKYGHKIKKEKIKICSLKSGKCPTITGIWLKRYKVRASSKIYKKLIRNYRYLTSNPIIDANSYLNSWKKYVALDGILKTIDYIEPVTMKKRDYIRSYVNQNKKNYISAISPYVKKLNSNYWKPKFYNAYLSNKLGEFYDSNKKYFEPKKD